MGWKLRYASHLGYRTPDPLFRFSAGSADPLRQIAYAAELGFAGVQDAWFVSRPDGEQRAIAKALDTAGLEAGCVVYAPREKIVQPLWASIANRDAIKAELTRGIEAAKRFNSRYLAVLSAADARVSPQLQFVAFVENLKWAADLAAAANVMIVLEPVSRRSIPTMTLHHIGEGYAAVKAVDHPAVRLIFDTSHVQIMDGDILTNLDAVWDAVALVQIADNPGRYEPGSGELNFTNILRAVKTRGYSGLVELEHGWSEPTLACEQRGIETLKQIDALL